MPDDVADAAARRTGRLDPEETLGLDHLSLAAAVVALRRARPRLAAGAGAAGAGDFLRLIETSRSQPSSADREVERRRRTSAPPGRTAAASTPTAGAAGETKPERISLKASKILSPDIAVPGSPPNPPPLTPAWPKRSPAGPLVVVAQDFVGGRRFLPAARSPRLRDCGPDGS